MKINKYLPALKRYLLDPDYRFLIRANRHRYDTLPDEAYLKRRFKACMGYDLDLNNPRTFNEKLQWLKLHDRNPLYTQLVDKYLVRQYVAERIGEAHLIPLLGVWDRPEEIDFQALPDQFVLKCNHNSGLGMYICRDKNALSKADRARIRKNLQSGLDQNYYSTSREWPYRNVAKKIIAEAYLSDVDGQLTDYKVHCFNGEPKMVLVCRDRFSAGGMTEDFFTAQWAHLPLLRPGIPNAAHDIEKPRCLEEMLRLSRVLSAEIPFLRTDFYIINETIYFGELTFFPMSGFGKYVPREWDERIGDELHLQNVVSRQTNRLKNGYSCYH